MRRLVIGALLLAILVGLGTTAWGLSHRGAGAGNPNKHGLSAGALKAAGQPNPTPTAQPTPRTITESSIVLPVEPWPPAAIREKIIQRALSDPETEQALRGHRYLVSMVNPYNDKSGTCPARPISCAEVGVYDYTAATGRKVIVNFVTWEVVARWAAPDFPGGFSDEEFAELAAIVAADPRFGPQAQLDPVSVMQIVDIDLGGQCGTLSPLHRCLTINVTRPDGSRNRVEVDMVDRRVVRARSY